MEWEVTSRVSQPGQFSSQYCLCCLSWSSAPALPPVPAHSRRGGARPSAFPLLCCQERCSRHPTLSLVHSVLPGGCLLLSCLLCKSNPFLGRWCQARLPPVWGISVHWCPSAEPATLSEATRLLHLLVGIKNQSSKH